MYAIIAPMIALIAAKVAFTSMFGKTNQFQIGWNLEINVLKISEMRILLMHIDSEHQCIS
jgi:hypothetical protein